jgi:hypothetical protein
MHWDPLLLKFLRGFGDNKDPHLVKRQRDGVNTDHVIAPERIAYACLGLQQIILVFTSGHPPILSILNYSHLMFRFFSVSI